MGSRRIVGDYRSKKARGASVPVPARDRQHWYASVGRVLCAVIGLSLTVVTVFGVKEAFIQVNTQKINTVQIEGTLHFVREDVLEEAVTRFVATSLVALDLEQLKAELELEPWINHAEVRRQWPDKLIIQVEEQVAIARWRKDQLLNQQGQIFSPQVIDDQLQLPYLSGPENAEADVMKQYQQFNQLLYPLGVRIRDLELNERSAWTMTFTNGVQVKVGKEDVLTRMRRLVVFLESDAGESIQNITSIDLRYRNGVAVAWREQEQVTAAEKKPEVLAGNTTGNLVSR